MKRRETRRTRAQGYSHLRVSPSITASHRAVTPNLFPKAVIPTEQREARACPEQSERGPLSITPTDCHDLEAPEMSLGKGFFDFAQKEDRERMY